jgi:hypothetical protein
LLNLSYHFEMKTILLLSLVLIGACGKSSNKKLYRVELAAVAKFVNEKPLPANPNLSLEKSFVNNSYPITIALYEDGRFYYDLPNLGDGNGTWKHSNGKIQLKAKRTIFNMYIEVSATDEKAESLTIQFSDRFGPNTLKMMNVNL